MTSATDRVRAAYAANTAAGDRSIWITLIDEADALVAAEVVERRIADGELLPLAGLVGAVKDNIDLAGVPTTAGCPAFAYIPESSATAVARLVDAGLVLIGKTNLDQFATGLVGTRSPYGAPASVADPDRVSGGSSSGSAVAVALGIVDVALGTDTAGSGRVPAAFNGIVGLKPTWGLVPTTGVVPACPSFDCVSIFATTVGLAATVLAVIGGRDAADSSGRTWPPDAPRAAPSSPVVAIPDDTVLGDLAPLDRAAFVQAVAALEQLGTTVKAIDLEPLLAVGRRLYGGPLVAERYASVGAFVDAHPDDVDPTVGPIIAGGDAYSAADLVNEQVALARAKSAIEVTLSGFDALVVPTVAEHPTFAEVAADPVGVNARLGRFTTFCNLLDLAAVAVPLPAHTPGATSTFGVTVLAAAFADQVAAHLAASIVGEDPPPSVTAEPGSTIVVVGAHLVGQPLNSQLTSRGGHLVQATTTAPDYRLFALETVPPKPGLIRSTGDDGTAIAVEVWELPPANFASFVAEIPPPLAVGRVELADGSEVTGFVLGASGPPDGAEEITHLGGWRAYLAELGR